MCKDKDFERVLNKKNLHRNDADYKICLKFFKDFLKLHPEPSRHHRVRLSKIYLN